MNLNFKKFIKFNLGYEKIVSLVLLAILTLQIISPLAAFANHNDNPWHDSKNPVAGSLPWLSGKDFDKLNSDIRRDVNNANAGEKIPITIFGYPIGEYITVGPGAASQNKAYEEAMERVSKLDKDSLLNFVNKNNPPTHENPQNNQAQISNCSGILSNFNIECLVTRGMAWVGYRILQLTSWLLFISANIFDVSAKLSMSYGSYSAKTASAVYEGWKAARNFVNLFFIFVILIIALAMVLQVQQYGASKLLPKLIAVALLINFSFFGCQQIINFTNSAALYFKNKIASGSNWDLSKIFVEKMNPQVMLVSGYQPQTISGPNITPAESDALNNQLKSGNVNEISIIIATFGGIVVMLAASFLLLAAGVLFLIRMAVLWNLIILAPVAIFAATLPATQSSFNKWWNRLTQEAFFAPSMMFMFYIEMSIINNDFLRKLAVSVGGADLGTGSSFIFNYYLLVTYFLLILLFMKAIWVAKSFGATGADVANRYADKGLKWVTANYGKKPLYATGRFARSVAAPYAEKIATGEMQKEGGRISQAMGYKWNIPGRILKGGITKGMEAAAKKITTTERSDVQKRAKDRFGDLTDKELAAETFMSRQKANGDLSISMKAVQMVQELQNRGKLNMVDPEVLKAAHKYMSSIGLNTKDIETFIPSLAGVGKEGKEKEEAIRKAVQRGQSDKVSDYVKVDSESKNNEVTNARRVEWGESHLKELFKHANLPASSVDKGAGLAASELFKNYIDKYGAKDPTTGKVNMNKVVEGLKNDKNFSAAKYFNSEEGNKVAEDYLTSKMGYTKSQIIPAKGAKEEKIKEALKEEDINIAEQISSEAKNKFADEPRTEHIVEIIKTADDKKLSGILDAVQSLNLIEKKELKTMLEKKDPVQAARLTKLNPEVENNNDKQQAAFKTMNKKEIEDFNYEGFKERVQKAGENVDLTTDQMLENMIKSFNLKQYKAMFDRNDEMSNQFVVKLQQKAGVGTPGEAGSLEKVVSYLQSENKAQVANHIAFTPNIKDLLGLMSSSEKSKKDFYSNEFGK